MHCVVGRRNRLRMGRVVCGSGVAAREVPVGAACLRAPQSASRRTVTICVACDRQKKTLPVSGASSRNALS